MAYTRMKKPPKARRREMLEGNAYNEVAPGLYPDEATYTLDTGEHVAVSLRKSRLPSNGGMEIRVWARWIEEDGSTVIDPDGNDMEIEFTHNADTALIAEYGVETVIRELLLCALGEPAETFREITVEPWPENLPEDFKREIAQGKHKLLGEPGTVVKQAIVHHDEHARVERSIRSAISYCSNSGEADCASLLG